MGHQNLFRGNGQRILGIGKQPRVCCFVKHDRLSNQATTIVPYYLSIAEWSVARSDSPSCLLKHLPGAEWKVSSQMEEDNWSLAEGYTPTYLWIKRCDDWSADLILPLQGNKDVYGWPTEKSRSKHHVNHERTFHIFLWTTK